MHKSARHLLIAAGLFAGLIAAGESSRAATMTVPGRASPDANSCFNTTSYPYSLRNDCSTTQALYLPFVMPWSNQNMVYQAVAQGASPSNNVGCLARSVSLHGAVHQATSRKYLTQFGVSQVIEVGYVWVPFQGTSAVECDVAPGGIVKAAVVNF
jgi:hypothetical protein